MGQGSKCQTKDKTKQNKTLKRKQKPKSSWLWNWPGHRGTDNELKKKKIGQMDLITFFF